MFLHGLSVLIAAILPTAFVDSIPDSVRTEDVISIAEARTRLIENRGRRVFFRIQGTITASNPDWSQRIHFILLDNTGGSDILCSCDDEWHIGDEVVAICTAMQPQYHHPLLRSEALEIKIVRRKAPPVPRLVHPVELGGHRNDFKVVRTEGVVVDAFLDDINPRWTVIALMKDDVLVTAWVKCADPGHSGILDLLDAEVQVTGIAFPDNSSFYRARGPWLMLSSPDAVKVAKEEIVEDDIEKIKAAIDKLSAAINPVFTKLYQQEQANNPNGGDQPGDDGNINGNGTVE